MTVEFDRTARDYAAYRTGFPDELFSRLGDLGVGLEGQRVADLGTGTGALARGFARRGCAVTGIDLAVPMLDEARRLDGEAGVRSRIGPGAPKTRGSKPAAGTWSPPARPGTGSTARARRVRLGASWSEAERFDVDVPYSHEQWRGRMRSCNGVGASLPEAVVRDFDGALARLLAECFPERTLSVPHRAWALVARAPR